MVGVDKRHSVGSVGWLAVPRDLRIGSLSDKEVVEEVEEVAEKDQKEVEDEKGERVE